MSDWKDAHENLAQGARWTETGQRTQIRLANDEPLHVNCRYWHHMAEPASEAADHELQDHLVARLGEPTGVALPGA